MYAGERFILTRDKCLCMLEGFIHAIMPSMFTVVSWLPVPLV